jgi:hypothetical protein
MSLLQMEFGRFPREEGEIYYDSWGNILHGLLAPFSCL